MICILHYRKGRFDILPADETKQEQREIWGNNYKCNQEAKRVAMTEFPTFFERSGIAGADELEEEELDDDEGVVVAEEVGALVLRVAVGETGEV